MKTTLAAPLLLLLLPLAAPAQEATLLRAAAATTTAAATDFVLDVGTHEVTDLIDRVAAYLDYNILCDANEAANFGKIRVTRSTQTDRSGTWELFGSLLYHKGLAILPLDETRGFYQVRSMTGPHSREISNSALQVPYTEVAAYARLKAIPIQTSVPLKNINATIATNALRPFFASAGNPGAMGLTLGNVGNNSHMLLQGFGHQVAAACRMLEFVDVGDESKSRIQVVRLEHAAPADLVTRIEETFGARSVQAQMQAGMPPAPTLRAVAHPALNAILLVGTDAQVEEGMALLARLDSPSAQEHRGVDDLQQRLQQLEERVQKLEQSLRRAR